MDELSHLCPSMSQEMEYSFLFEATDWLQYISFYIWWLFLLKDEQSQKIKEEQTWQHLCQELIRLDTPILTAKSARLSKQPTKGDLSTFRVANLVVSTVIDYNEIQISPNHTSIATFPLETPSSASNATCNIILPCNKKTIICWNITS